VALALLAALGGSARAEGDRMAGEAIARQWCGECHATDASSSATDAVPAWRTIATDPTKDEASLKAFLENPHPAMRHIPLTERDIDDVIAYILSLGFE
jgi:mono/diheme cytochrome c family protein